MLFVNPFTEIVIPEKISSEEFGKKENRFSFRVAVPVLHTQTAAAAFFKKNIPPRHLQPEETLQHCP